MQNLCKYGNVSGIRDLCYVVVGELFHLKFFAENKMFSVQKHP